MEEYWASMQTLVILSFISLEFNYDNIYTMLFFNFLNSVNFSFHVINSEHDDNLRSISTSREQGKQGDQGGSLIEPGEPEECGIVDCKQKFAIEKCPKTCSNDEPELCKVADCQKPRSLQFCPKTCGNGKQKEEGRT